MEELCQKLRDLQADYSRSTIWISGDTNIPDIDWTGSTVTGNSYPTQISTLLTVLTYDLGLEQVVNFPTRGQNTIDIFLTNRPSLISKCKPIPGISDHDIIFTETLTRVPHQKPPSRIILLWKRADTEVLQRAVHDFSDNFVSKYSSSKDIETLWTSFRDLCVKPSVTSSHPNYPVFGTVSHG